MQGQSHMRWVGDHEGNASGLVHPGGVKGRATAPTQTPMGPGVERLGPGRHCMVPPSNGWAGAASWFRAETWAPGSEGGGGT